MNNNYKRYEYEDYSSYLKSQLRHANTMDRTHRRPFARYIGQIQKFFPECKKILCIGSRDVSEVYALRSAGYDAVGIDLFSTDISTIKLMDMHNIINEFSKDEFDLIYACHALEHSYDPEIVLQGFKKVSKLGAFIVLPFLLEPNFKDPVQFNFMNVGAVDGTGVSESLIEEDFANLGCNCTVTDIQLDPFGNREDGYWITVRWQDN